MPKFIVTADCAPGPLLQRAALTGPARRWRLRRGDYRTSLPTVRPGRVAQAPPSGPGRSKGPRLATRP